MGTVWDKRYSTDEFVYGTEPNRFFKTQIDSLKPGKILFLGEGEGRNAVYAAAQNWQVNAVDSSSVGREKALKLAEKKSVSIDYGVADLNDYSFDSEKYDAVVLIFLHLPEVLREKVHASVNKTLKPGGMVILESFDKEQIKYNTGGPKNEAMLYSLEEIFEDFQDMELITFSKEITNISEGDHHKGDAAVIRLVGKKPLIH